MPKQSLRSSSLVAWYRLGLGVVALALGVVMLLRALLEAGSWPLLVVGLIFLGFGVLRLRAGWNLLGIRIVK